MALSDPIDIYCERLGPGLLAEPLNLLTNGLIVLAGISALLMRPRDIHGANWLVLLPGLVIVIGMGSAAFHSFANRWSLLADVIPIGIYMYVYIGFCAAVLLKYRWPGAVVACICLAIALKLGSLLPARLFNGSNDYFGAAAALLVLALLARQMANPAWRSLALAFVVFCVSLTFRSIDMALCDRWPYGTHFLWHSCNAILLFLTLKAAAVGLRWQHDQAPSQATPGRTVIDRLRG